MNFIEAVEALKEGRCEAIKPFAKNFGNPYHLKLDETGALIYPHYPKGTKLHVNSICGDWELVNPKPQYEEVEIKRWEIFDKDGEHLTYSHISYKDACDHIAVSNGGYVVELTGIMRREIKPKLKCRELIGETDSSGVLLSPSLI